MIETLHLGTEHDEALRARLFAVLRAMGARIDDESWALAGSQELATVQVRLGDHQLTIESETYIGLSITGPGELVREIAERVLRAI